MEVASFFGVCEFENAFSVISIGTKQDQDLFNRIKQLIFKCFLKFHVFTLLPFFLIFFFFYKWKGDWKLYYSLTERWRHALLDVSNWRSSTQLDHLKILVSNLDV